MSLSAVVLAKNEEGSITNCLKSLQFADEIIVIDDNSADKTVSLARGLGAKVYKRALSGDFAKQRNFGLKKARGEWVVFVDADELVTGELAKQIEAALGSSVDGYYIKRQDCLWGKNIYHGEAGSAKLLRLVRKGAGKWVRSVHETLEVSGKTEALGSLLMHYPHQSIREFVGHINVWSSMHAEANRKEGKRSSLPKIILWPLAHFSRNYFLRFGFLDGGRGLVIAILMSFHSFVSWSKLYFLQDTNVVSKAEFGSAKSNHDYR